MIAQLDQVRQTVEHVAGRDDRYLLLVLFFGSCGALYWMARFFIRQYERMTTEHRSSRESYGLALQQLVKDGHEIQRDLTIRLTEITEVLRTCAVLIASKNGEGKGSVSQTNKTV